MTENQNPPPQTREMGDSPTSVNDEFDRRCAANPGECPQSIWETLCEERGLDPIEAREGE